MPQADQDEPENLGSLLDKLDRAAEGKDKVRLGDVHEAIGERAFGPMLLVTGLAALTPLGVIPGLPTAFAVVVVLIAGQIVIGRDRFWIPGKLRDRRIGADRLTKAVRWARKPARVVDRIVRPRLSVFTKAGFTRAVALICVVIAFAIPPLELLPFAVIAPASAITAFGLGLTARDGLLVLIALLRSILAPVFMVAVVTLSFAAAAGFSVLVWQHLIGVDVDWSVFPVSFMALIAVGADYSMLFAARIREESGDGMIRGIMRSFGSTGSVITTAGIVFALTMFALMSGRVINLLQIGFTIGVGLLIDITLVRTVLVPAAMAMIGNRIWWPSKPMPATTHSTPAPVTVDA